MAKTSDPLKAAADAALDLAATRPWRGISLRDLAAKAGLPMSAFYGLVRSKDDVVDAVLARLDRAAAETAEIDPDASVRERVFDAAMARYDAMQARRAAVLSMLQGALESPLDAARMWPRLTRSARWLLEVAGVDTSGGRGAARTQGFALVLARTTRAWMKDDDAGLSRTMASLDRALRDVESWSETLDRWRARRANDAAEPEEPPEGEA